LRVYFIISVGELAEFPYIKRWVFTPLPPSLQHMPM